MHKFLRITFFCLITSAARAGANFGKILTAMDPRIMQFALKYVF